MHILSQFAQDKASFKISKSVGKIFKVIVTIPAEHTTEYVVGEKEKDFLVKVFKDRAVVKELEGVEKDK